MNIVVNVVNIVHTSQKSDRPVCWWNVWTASHRLPPECSPWNDPLKNTVNSSSTQKSFSSPFFLSFLVLFRFFFALTFSNFTLVSHEEIRCRLASARCDRLYRAEVSEATGPTSAHSREAVHCPSSRTKCSDQKFLSVLQHWFFI